MAEGFEAAASEAELLADGDGVALVRALRRAPFDSVAFGRLAAAAAGVLVGLSGDACAVAFVVVDRDPESACFVLFCWGELSAVLVGSGLCDVEDLMTGGATPGFRWPEGPCQAQPTDPFLGTVKVSTESWEYTQLPFSPFDHHRAQYWLPRRLQFAFAGLPFTLQTEPSGFRVIENPVAPKTAAAFLDPVSLSQAVAIPPPAPSL